MAGHSRKTLVGISSQTLKTQNSPALQLGCFSAARPVGRLSFAASAAVGSGLFFAEERLDVVSMHQQLAVFVADCTVLGVGFALLGDEGAELGAEVFDLRQTREVVLVEVPLRLAVLLNLVGMGVVEFARVARRLVLRENLARFSVGNYLPSQRVDLGDARVERRYAVFGGG